MNNIKFSKNSNNIISSEDREYLFKTRNKFYKENHKIGALFDSSFVDFMEMGAVCISDAISYAEVDTNIYLQRTNKKLGVL